MTAIETRFLGPTNHRGSRYKAVAMGTKHTVTLEGDGRLGNEANHQAAAAALIKRQGWDYAPWIQGDSDRGYVFVCEKGDRI